MANNGIGIKTPSYVSTSFFTFSLLLSLFFFNFSSLFAVESNSRYFKELENIPFVEKISYKTKVSWLNGRPAWGSDYSRYYKTSLEFIELSRKKPYSNYEKNETFYVFKKNYPLSFVALVQIDTPELYLFAVNTETKERFFIKKYTVSLGRKSPSSPSGSLTPLGRYSLGSKTAVHKPSTTGTYKGESIRMMEVFGTRWIPFGEEIEGCSSPAKSFGIHGAPWKFTIEGSSECKELARDYLSDGCIRLADENLKEFYAIVISRPAEIEITKDPIEKSFLFRNTKEASLGKFTP